MYDKSKEFVKVVLGLFVEKTASIILFGDDSSDAIELEDKIDKLIGQATDEELKEISENSLFKQIGPAQAYRDLVKRRERNRIH